MARTKKTAPTPAETVPPPYLFPLGEIRTTSGVEPVLVEMQAAVLLARHVSGDWGDLDDEDKRPNDDAVQTGGPIASRYTSPVSGRHVWIITECDRSATTILLPEEY